MKTTLEILKAQRDEIEAQMPQTFAQQSNKNKALFLISRDIEQIENPESYNENKNHWDGHELRL